jgi:predicted RNase H-like nuclease
MSMRPAHGPNLPYKLVAGVIPCRGGWLVASAKLQGVTIAAEEPRILDGFTAVLDEKPAFTVIALHAPIGYLDKAEPGGRTCDREARALLGPRRGAAVRSAPSWAAFEAQAGGPTGGLDAVTAALLPRYREVASEMAGYRQRTVFEAHPELSFYQLNGDQPLRYSKRFAAGRHERRELLVTRISGVERILEAKVRGATPAHLLDAAACLWTARRTIARAGARLPADPEWDNQGLRMEFVR